MSLNPLWRTLCARDHVITQDAWQQEFIILVDGNGFVARFVNNDYSRYSSVSSMLTDLTWPSLQSRRSICDLGMFNKIHRGQVLIHMTLPLCLPRVAVQGRVMTLSLGPHPLQLKLTNTLSLSLYGTRYRLMLLGWHLIQNLCEECQLL